MPAIPSNEQYLFDLRNLVQSALQRKGEVSTKAPGGEVSATELPDSLQEWLGQLTLLYGLPIDNLAANSSLLPTESIRFFYLDENWINSLLDGALSIGAQNSKDTALQMGVQSSIKVESRLSRQLIRSNILDLAPPAELTTSTITSGFLLRSEVVFGWPGLEVMAYADATGNTELSILRMDRLAPDILLCIFNGVMERLVIAEPKEGLRFGAAVDAHGIEGLTMEPRYLGATSEQPTGKPLASPKNNIYPTPQYRNEDLGVVDVLKTLEEMQSVLDDNNVTIPDGSMNAAVFAVEMIYTAEEVVFTLQKS